MSSTLFLRNSLIYSFISFLYFFLFKKPLLIFITIISKINQGHLPLWMQVTVSFVPFLFSSFLVIYDINFS